MSKAASIPPVSLAPKGEFLSDPKVAGSHQDIMASPSFRHAARMALLEYQYGQKFESNPAAAGMKLQGAQDFLKILLNLGNPTSTASQPDTEQLTPV